MLMFPLPGAHMHSAQPTHPPSPAGHTLALRVDEAMPHRSGHGWLVALVVLSSWFYLLVLMG